MSDKWTIRMKANGGYSFTDETGNEAGRYSDPEVAATHHAFALQENRKMRAALEKCLHLIEKGLEVRIGDKWPALQGPMNDCKKDVRAILRPEYQRVIVDQDRDP